MKQIVVSGRFALYPQMVRFIKRLQQAGIIVLSPSVSMVSGSLGTFRLLESDCITICGIPKRLWPMVLEEAHCARIRESDALIIYNPDGVDGKSTLTEMGVAYGKGVPIYSVRPIGELAFRRFTKVASQRQIIKILTQSSSP